MATSESYSVTALLRAIEEYKQHGFIAESAANCLVERAAELTASSASSRQHEGEGDVQGWRPIESAPKDRGIIVSDGKVRAIVMYQRLVGWRHAGEDHTKRISSVQGVDNMGPLVAWMELPPLPTLPLPEPPHED